MLKLIIDIFFKTSILIFFLHKLFYKTDLLQMKRNDFFYIKLLLTRLKKSEMKFLVSHVQNFVESTKFTLDQQNFSSSVTFF